MSGLRDAVARPSTDLELSVVIAAYDAEGTLGAQLDALAAQRVPFAWEVVVADNGSGDGTAALARSYAGRLRIRVVDASATPGAGAARNVGVSVARAPLVAFCDADDVVADDWLAAMRAALDRHAFVAGRFDGARLNSASVLRSRELPQQRGLQESARLPGLHAAGAGNMGIRADVFRAVGGFDPRCLYLEDADLCWRVQLAGVPLTWAPEVVLHVRLRGSLWSTARQGYHYGTGERWLALRYREQDERLRELVAERAVAAARAEAATADEAATGAPPRRSGGALSGAALTGAALGLALTDGLAGVAVAGDVVAGAALTGAGIAGAGRRSSAGRAVRRVAATAGDLARVRSVGDLGRWCWDVGWGLGYAFGKVEVPEPVVVRPTLLAGGSPVREAGPSASAPAAPATVDRGVPGAAPARPCPDALAS
jgi:GT2 family glycosyltransferase